MPVPLTSVELHAILSKHLAPMFPGVTVVASALAIKVPTVVVQEGPCELLVKPDAEGDYCYRLKKTHPFEPDDVQIIEKFTQAFREKLIAAGQPFFHYLVDKCPQEVVASSMQPKVADDSLLPSIISLLRKWASETYEGQRISVAIGIDPYAEPDRISNVHLSEISGRDYAKVISNGIDTLLVLSPSGHIVEHIALRGSVENDTKRWATSSFAPRRHYSLAAWSQNARVALALNRQGEILVFKRQQLQFAFRRGTWLHFAHSAMVARMGGSLALMRAIYATCLDVSFARTGGCLAVVERGNPQKIAKYVSSLDLLSRPLGDKATLICHLVGEPFTKIPRPIREELAALDGAIVLNHEGKVLAAGAIVALSGGSDGGGRKAAAKALSRLGLAIKISSDGGITAFTKFGPLANPDIAFEI